MGVVNADADQTQGPRRLHHVKSHLDEIFRLMDLHGIPGEERTEVAEGDPPKSAGAGGTGKHTGSTMFVF
jgi:hypothetical protein